MRGKNQLKLYMVSCVAALGISFPSFAGDEAAPNHRIQQTIFQFGKFKGEPIDLSTNRPAKLIPPAEAAAFGITEGQVAVANVTHRGKFVISIFDPTKVTDVALGKVKVTKIGLLPHMYLRVWLPDTDKARFISQDNPSGPPLRNSESNSLIISLAAVGSVNHPYDPVKDMRAGIFTRNFTSDVELLSADYYISLLKKLKRTPSELKLAFEPAIKARLLMSALTMADKDEYSVPFNMCVSNCTTRLWDIIDNAIGKPMPRTIGAFMGRYWGNASIPAAKARGLFSPESPKFIEAQAAEKPKADCAKVLTTAAEAP